MGRRNDGIYKGKRERGMPAPVTFDFWKLADSTLITQIEVAAIERRSVVAIETGRLAESDGLEWRYINGGRPRCVVGSLKKKMLGNPLVRRPAVQKKEQAQEQSRENA